MRSWRPAGVIVAVLALWAALPMPASSQDEGTLRDRIQQGKEREQALAGAIARLDDLLAQTQREIAIVQGRPPLSLALTGTLVGQADRVLRVRAVTSRLDAGTRARRASHPAGAPSPMRRRTRRYAARRAAALR